MYLWYVPLRRYNNITSREVELRELVEEHHGEQQRQHRHRNLNDMSSRWAFLR